MGIKLYADWSSQPCRAVGIFMTINHIEFEFLHVDLMGGGTKDEGYRAINPCQSVPTLIEGDFKLIESVAMLKYLAGKDGVSEHWYPKNPNQRAKVDEYMAWQHSGIRPKASECMIETAWKPVVLKVAPDQETLKQKTAALDGQLDIIESYFLGEKPFLTGNDITIADVMCSMELNSVDFLIFDLGDRYPNLQAYLTRVADKLSPHYEKYNESIAQFATEKLGRKK